jgi:hypothetical protein
LNWGLVGIIIIVMGFSVAVVGSLLGSHWRNGLLIELGPYGVASVWIGVAMILGGWWLKNYKE